MEISPSSEQLNKERWFYVRIPLFLMLLIAGGEYFVVTQNVFLIGELSRLAQNSGDGTGIVLLIGILLGLLFTFHTPYLTKLVPRARGKG